MSLSVNDRQTNRNCPRRRSIPAAQNKCLQLVSLVDLLTSGFQFEAIEKTYFAAVGPADRRPFVLPRRGINSDGGNFARVNRGYDTDGSAAVRIRDGTERETTRGGAATKRERRARGKEESSSCASERSVSTRRCIPWSGRNTHVQQVKGRYRAPRLFPDV